MEASDSETRAQPSEAPTTAIGGIYRDLLDWSGSLPRWQQELLRRVLRKKELSSEDLDELCSGAVAETEQQASQYAPLAESDLPSIAAAEERITLVAVRNVRNVNVLRAGENLTFGPQLTVIYGDNASGKSGYGRVLKKVYRARVVDDILGDVRADNAPNSAAAATFVVKPPTGNERECEWVDAFPLPGVGRFAVLDGACSQTYIRGGSLEAGPAGIDVPERFAKALDRVKEQLKRLASEAQPKKQALQPLENETRTGRFIKSLSSATSSDAISAATAWTPEHAAELTQLDTALAAAKAQTPAARRSGLQARVRALQALVQRVTGWMHAVSAGEVHELRTTLDAITEADAALRAVKSLGDASVSSDRLQGTAWTALLSAASQYVISSPVADRSGDLAIDGRCVLCWQELDVTAKERLKRFHDHLDGVAQKSRQAAVARKTDLVAAVQRIPAAVSPEDEALLSGSGGVTQSLGSLLALLVSRQQQILASVASAQWPTVTPNDHAPLKAVQDLYAATAADFATLPATDEEAERQVVKLTEQRLELTTRKAAADALTEIRQFVKNTLEYNRFKAAESGVNTRAASGKVSELHGKHMTELYARLVNEELAELRFRRLKPTLAQKTNKAKVEVTPLVSPELKHLSAEKVFSEGERTAIALACFLAELRLGNDRSGLIFDDPVSSLDHNVRDDVARRLVAAAKDRQVIVFTHDLAFLADLREQAKKIQAVDCQFRTLTATDYHAGFVEDEEPFGARKLTRRIGVLKELVVASEKAAKAGDIELLRNRGKDFYDRLRSTWERFIEERVFANVVQRLERNVIPGALARVAYSKELGEKVHEGWRRCSNAIEAHDHAPSAGGQSYSVEAMKADLQMLVEVEKATPQP